MASNGRARGLANSTAGQDYTPAHIKQLNERLSKVRYGGNFHQDELIGNARESTGLLARLRGNLNDASRIFAVKNWSALSTAFKKAITGQGADKFSLAQLISSLSGDSKLRAKFLESQVIDRYTRMLHPPVTYLGEAFQYRSADGRFMNALHPQLGQAGAPYAKTVPAKTHPLGALPDPGDLFDRLMAREGEGRQSKSGLSSMLLHFATIVIHDIFRTNDQDKNISDTSSYLDLSPLYGFNEGIQRKVRDNKYKLGLLKPDAFAEDRLVRQAPAVCIILVMFNRYHNYCATQLRQINENGRFSIPKRFEGSRLAAAARNFTPIDKQDAVFRKAIAEYEEALQDYLKDEKSEKAKEKRDKAEAAISRLFTTKTSAELEAFNAAHDAAWAKLDDDLFGTARLITCGMFAQIAVHDYLKAFMGLHQWNTDFTLDPCINIPEHKEVTRGLGNQVTVEFNLLYRFHPAISRRDEAFTEKFFRQYFNKPASWDVKDMGLETFLQNMGQARAREAQKKGGKRTQPEDQNFGLENDPVLGFKRNSITGLFDDQQMINELTKAQAEPMANFGPRNIPRSLKPVEMLGIMQARKWGVGTLNDFREFFRMKRHDSFESITPNVEVQEALRDLYENVDKVELYPGAFCESDGDMVCDPGPHNPNSALWIAIFSDAVTLVRSDRFYTVDWNTHSLTSWGMKELTPDPNVLKGSMFYRLYQRAFPGWFPTDSVLFFHPFYTPHKNAEYAVAQGYAKDFNFTHGPSGINTDASLPKRPSKPIYLTKLEDIKALLADQSDTIVHPVRLHLNLVPNKVAEVLELHHKHTPDHKYANLHVDAQALTTYLTDMMRNMILRNAVSMDSKKGIFQIDVTKDFAIPVVARYVSEFLGIGHLVESKANPTAKYTENEICMHITNCQKYLSYNSDETKLLTWRHVFRSSMKFLYDLALQGNAREANKLGLTRFISGLWPLPWKANAMSQLGFKVAQQILKTDRDIGRAAARMLMVALDSACNNVLAFNSVLNEFMEGLYADVNGSDWLKIQALAFNESTATLSKLQEIVLKAQRKSIRLPIIYKVKLAKGEKTHDVVNASGTVLFKVKDGDTIICDPYAAKTTDSHDFEKIAYPSSFTSHLSRYQSQEAAILSLVSMIQVLAQMKNLRRGHDAQGMLKQIDIPSSPEGYASFMAEGRLDQIQHDVENADGDLSKVFNTDILKPTMKTYLTPEWDEMVPFPTTWKLRFEGFGASNYVADNVLKSASLPDAFPPFYFPKGPSSTAGTWGLGEALKEHAPAQVSGATAGCSLGAPSQNPGTYASIGV